MRQLACVRFSWGSVYVQKKLSSSKEISIKLLWEPRDLWIGLFWAKSDLYHRMWYICFIPCLPIRIHFKRSYGGNFGKRPWYGSWQGFWPPSGRKV
jgi:hypothetical protein